MALPNEILSKLVGSTVITISAANGIITSVDDRYLYIKTEGNNEIDQYIIGALVEYLGIPPRLTLSPPLTSSETLLIDDYMRKQDKQSYSGSSRSRLSEEEAESLQWDYELAQAQERYETEYMVERYNDGDFTGGF